MINPPKTIEEARAYRYGKWGGNERGTPYKEGFCAEGVWTNERWSREYQCERKATKGLFCGQHDPEAKERRRKASDERYRRQMDKVLAPSRLIEKYRAALERIESHGWFDGGDLAKIAREALKEES